jgi:hypothetical protein
MLTTNISDWRQIRVMALRLARNTFKYEAHTPTMKKIFGHKVYKSKAANNPIRTPRENPLLTYLLTHSMVQSPS